MMYVDLMGLEAKKVLWKIIDFIFLTNVLTEEDYNYIKQNSDSFKIMRYVPYDNTNDNWRYFKAHTEIVFYKGDEPVLSL